jgi:DNA-binding MarR family transcriptional regulator
MTVTGFFANVLRRVGRTIRLMGFESRSEDELEDLAGIYKGLSHEARLAILYGLNEDASLNQISGFLSITRGALQDHIEMLLDAELIYRPTDSGKTYDLTPLGEHLAEQLEKNEDEILEALDELKTVETSLEENYREQVNQIEDEDLVDDKKIERKVHSEKWEQVAGKIWDILKQV